MSKLHVDSVRKSFKEKMLLSDIYLSCEQGEIVGLLGRNGSGKSTLLKIIFGVEPAENKFIRIENKVLRTVSDSRNLINYLPQSNFLHENLKVRILIKLFLPGNRATKLLENEHIRTMLEKKFGVLSGGEKRIVEIFLLLYSEARFILLDEPFEGVSTMVREVLMQSIYEEKGRKGFIITDHDYENVLKIADKILFLQDGILKEIKSKRELMQLGYLSAERFNEQT